MLVVAGDARRSDAARAVVKQLVVFSTACFVLMLTTMVQAASVVIDDFTDPDPEVVGLSGDASPFTDSVVGSAGVLGGDRDYEAEWIGLATIPFGSSTSIGESRLRLATFAPTDVVEVTLDYPSAGGADITDGGLNDLFQFDFAFVEGGSSPTLSLDISVTTGTGVGTFTGDIPESPLGPTQYLAAFGDFTGTPDFTDVDSITIAFNTANATAVDFELDRPIITTNRNPLPEPSGVLLLLVGAMCAGSWRFRKR